MLTSSEMDHTDGCSGNDPPCVGVVQSIKDHPRRPPHVLLSGSHPVPNRLHHLQHSGKDPRYVKHGFV